MKFSSGLRPIWQSTLSRVTLNRRLATAATSSITPDYNGPSFEDVVAIRQKNLGPTLKCHFKTPVLIHNGKMQWLFDSNGKKYLDMFGGIVTVSVGHCHPKVNAALKNQVETLWHTTNIYLHPKIHEFAEKLASKMPGDLKTVYFVNSGSEANDLAMLLARLHTKNFDILTFRNAYHGTSPYTMGLTAQSSWRYSLPGVNSGIQHVLNPDPYRGRWGGKNCRESSVQTTRDCACSPNNCEATQNYFQDLEELFRYSIPVGKCAGMFAESIQGVGGTVQFTKGYLKQAAELVRKNGGVFVSDEVQTGFGRTGSHFWGFESHDIIPDIVTMAKGIGNGFPLAAVVTTSQIAESLTQALHFNTFGGNPMASAVGLAVLEVIEEEKLQENSLKVGNYFLKGLAELRSKFNIIGDVRGQGLMIGVEFVSNKDTRQPLSKEHFGKIWEECKDLGVLFGQGGFYGNVLRIKPPMCINKSDVDLALDVLERSIKAHI
ncbi:alanine--glyoxylate aminotransferase 2, mitochondrial isoform X1 [Bradysia coprophila]|uniref:alanine--glyoxylate aminotransferase 2, mitochondrial isoform X1 n=1 Tax=Bradysia coprophila TaxID=38358 RepID=UPI00187D7346|nr:alanine--glyoxylate aminotransferase 2, mitochondrial isoform X1 [Bradysia coprophila]